MCIATSALKAVMQVFSCEGQFFSLKAMSFNEKKSNPRGKDFEKRQSFHLKCCANKNIFLT